MTLHCDECSCNPADNDEKYYSIRTSISGRDFDGISDAVMCGECLESWIEDNGVSSIVSIVRIENPLYTVGD